MKPNSRYKEVDCFRISQEMSALRTSASGIEIDDLKHLRVEPSNVLLDEGGKLSPLLPLLLLWLAPCCADEPPATPTPTLPPASRQTAVMSLYPPKC